MNAVEQIPEGTTTDWKAFFPDSRFFSTSWSTLSLTGNGVLKQQIELAFPWQRQQTPAHDQRTPTLKTWTLLRWQLLRIIQPIILISHLNVFMMNTQPHRRRRGPRHHCHTRQETALPIEAAFGIIADSFVYHLGELVVTVIAYVVLVSARSRDNWRHLWAQAVMSFDIPCHAISFTLAHSLRSQSNTTQQLRVFPTFFYVIP